MDHICLRTDGLSPRYRSMEILPDYGCMILSPANLWARDSIAFQMDPNLIATVFNYKRSREGNDNDNIFCVICRAVLLYYLRRIRV